MYSRTEHHFATNKASIEIIRNSLSSRNFLPTINCTDCHGSIGKEPACYFLRHYNFQHDSINLYVIAFDGFDNIRCSSYRNKCRYFVGKDFVWRENYLMCCMTNSFGSRRLWFGFMWFYLAFVNCFVGNFICLSFLMFTFFLWSILYIWI